MALFTVSIKNRYSPSPLSVMERGMITMPPPSGRTIRSPRPVGSTIMKWRLLVRAGMGISVSGFAVGGRI
jgi:hypothetical protein